MKDGKYGVGNGSAAMAVEQRWRSGSDATTVAAATAA